MCLKTRRPRQKYTTIAFTRINTPVRLWQPKDDRMFIWCASQLGRWAVSADTDKKHFKLIPCAGTSLAKRLHNSSAAMGASRRSLWCALCLHPISIFFYVPQRTDRTLTASTTMPKTFRHSIWLDMTLGIRGIQASLSSLTSGLIRSHTWAHEDVATLTPQQFEATLDKVLFMVDVNEACSFDSCQHRLK